MALLAYIFFYPTLGWNLLLSEVLHIYRWWDWIDDHVLLGALPTRYHVPRLKAAGISGVINTCNEYRGPLNLYETHGIRELYLPTVDFTPPSLADVQRGVAFIDEHIARGEKVYVHCKAGRGRSATIAICYLISKGVDPEIAQKLLREKRPQVLARLTERKVVREFAEQFKGYGAEVSTRSPGIV